ncbi:MAG TPA: hypothetical protein VF130_00300 [Candidatus Binatia bacterium]
MRVQCKGKIFYEGLKKFGPSLSGGALKDCSEGGIDIEILQRRTIHTIDSNKYENSPK